MLLLFYKTFCPPRSSPFQAGFLNVLCTDVVILLPETSAITITSKSKWNETQIVKNTSQNQNTDRTTDRTTDRQIPNISTFVFFFLPYFKKPRSCDKGFRHDRYEGSTKTKLGNFQPPTRRNQRTCPSTWNSYWESREAFLKTWCRHGRSRRQR